MNARNYTIAELLTLIEVGNTAPEGTLDRITAYARALEDALDDALASHKAGVTPWEKLTDVDTVRSNV